MTETGTAIRSCSACNGTGRFRGVFGPPDWPLCTKCGGTGRDYTDGNLVGVSRPGTFKYHVGQAFKEAVEYGELNNQLLPAARAFLEPYKELSDDYLYTLADRNDANSVVRIKMTAITPHIAERILTFRKIIEQAGG